MTYESSNNLNHNDRAYISLLYGGGQALYTDTTTSFVKYIVILFCMVAAWRRYGIIVYCRKLDEILD